MKTVAIIQARRGSSRLPDKILKNIKGKPVLAHDIERIRQAKQIDEIVIATTEDENDTCVATLAKQCGASVFRGSENDVLARYYGAAEAYGADIVLRITSDCPLIDPHIIDEMVLDFKEHQYDISYNIPFEGEELTYPRGLDVEIFSFATLEEAYQKAVKQYDREHVTPYIYDHCERKHYHRFAKRYPNYRWTLDTQQDFELITKIYEYLYHGQHDFYTEDVLKLLEEHKELLAINGDVVQKSRCGLLSIHQPNYWPYPGLIGKIAHSDAFLFLTEVQFDKSSWQNRNRIRIKEGWKYLTVPVVSKGKETQKIKDVAISNQENWRNQHFNAIQFAYRKAPYYDRYEPFLKSLYGQKWTMLAELDIYIMEFILKELDIKTKLIYDRDLTITGEKNELLIDVCGQLGAKQYMSNKGSENYVEIEKFNAAGIDHLYIDYKGVEYPQMYEGFEGQLSVLDMLLNCGPEKTREIVLDKNNYTFSEWNKKI